MRLGVVDILLTFEKIYQRVHIVYEVLETKILSDLLFGGDSHLAEVHVFVLGLVWLNFLDSTGKESFLSCLELNFPVMLKDLN